MRLRKTIALTGSVVALALGAAPALADDASVSVSPADCDIVVAPNGSDSNPGTVEAPMATSNKAAAALEAGQVLCFRSGTYESTVAIGLSIRTPNAVVTSYPGEQATLVGALRIERPAVNTVVENLKLNGRNPQDIYNPLVFADGAVLHGNEITNDHSTNCVLLTHYYDDPGPKGVVIENNNIHGCGSVPSTNQEHGIYLSSASDTTIRHNLIWDNTDRGIQMFTDVRGTEVYGNVIDGNGEGVIISGAGGESASNNTVEHNLITNSKIRRNVESWFDQGTSPGTGNVVRDNCIYGAADKYYARADNSGLGDEVGFKAMGNLIADPGYEDAAHGDFTLRPGSPCAGILEGGVPTTTPSTTTSPTPPSTSPSNPPSAPIQLRTADPAVPVGGVAVLHGTVPRGAAGLVVIKMRRHHRWHRVGTGHVRGKRFVSRMHISSTAHYKASAKGALDSNAVTVKTRTPKHKS
jgi:parallel beta-helix repeat protein